MLAQFNGPQCPDLEVWAGCLHPESPESRHRFKEGAWYTRHGCDQYDAGFAIDMEALS